jgi:hypothetical protein
MERFSTLLGNPTLNNDVNEDWAEFEAEFRISLPRDYKTFMSAYGPGEVRGHMIFFHPKAPREPDSLSLAHEIETYAEADRYVRSMDSSCIGWPIYPEHGWAMPIARAMTGEQLLLRPASAEKADPVFILNWRHGWDEYDMSFNKLMETGLTGTLDPPLFAKAEGQPNFARIGRVVA